MWKIQNHSFKKNGGNTTVQSYQPTEQEIRLQKQAADYAEAVAPNALWLNNVAQGLLKDSLGTIQVDYNQLMKDAQSQISSAQQGVAGLAQGKLPEEYQKNMEASIQKGVQNSVGSAVNSLAGRGVLSSSVTNNALQGINEAAAGTMAEQYQNNIGTLNGLYGQQAALAGQNITTAAGAQEAAQQPALNLWNASLGLNTGGTLGALNAIGGQGTTTTTQKTSGGGGLFGGILTGLAGNPGLFGAACFTDDTKVRTPDGEKYIRHISVGDKVIAEDGTEQEVIETMIPKYSVVYTVVADGSGKKNYVNTTLTQPLMTSDGDFVDVAMLRIGTNLKGAGKVLGVVESGERKVYDLKVTGPNTYFANGFVAKGATDEW